MSSPEWRRVRAADGSTDVRILRHSAGGVSIKLSSGPVSMVASVSADDLAFLLFGTKEQKEAA